MMGYVYLIKFEKKLSHAQYYIGYSGTHPKDRYKDHKKNLGARILQVLNEKGIDYYIVRIWKNQNRDFERKLKNRKKARLLDTNLTHLPLK